MEVVVGIGEVEIFVGQTDVDFHVLVGVLFDYFRLGIAARWPVERCVSNRNLSLIVHEDLSFVELVVGLFLSVHHF